MTYLWNGVWNGFGLPLIAVARRWSWRRRRNIPMLDPRSLSAHWQRDLGFDL